MENVVYVDGLRTAFGRAGPKGMFWRTRADDMAVKVVRELLRRNPNLPPERIGDVVMAATAQVGDQGLTLGRDVVLAGGVEHMGHHPMGAEVELNPRYVAERLVDPSAVTMGETAENLHDRFP